jgi:hypothetical protein
VTGVPAPTATALVVVGRLVGDRGTAAPAFILFVFVLVATLIDETPDAELLLLLLLSAEVASVFVLPIGVVAQAAVDLSYMSRARSSTST